MHRILNKHVVQLVAANPSPMTSAGTNCYLIGSGVKRTLIDTGSPGVGKSCWSALENYQKEAKVKFELDRIICTHWHPDHTGGINELREKGLVCPTLKHEKVPYQVGRSYPGAGEFLPSGQTYAMVEEGDFVKVQNDEVISVEEGVDLIVKFTPGHADDHICLFLTTPGEGALFSGDNVLGGTTAVFDNYHAYMDSLTRLRQLTPEGMCIYPGHGEMIEDGRERIEFYIEHRLERERQIIGCLDNGKHQTIADLVEAIYVGLDEKLIPAASINVLMTLDKLFVENKVTENDDGSWSLC